MQTKHYHMEHVINKYDLQEVSTMLQNGETVAFPTETVYGLGADATNEKAVKKIFKAKGRPSDNPLIVHVATKEKLLSLVKNIRPYVETLIDAFSPGPITYVLKHNAKVAPTVTAGLETIGVRIPDHPVALALLQQAQTPVAAPSANRSGRPSPTEAAHVAEDLTGRIAAIVDGGKTDIGIESTVVDCTGDVPIILRPGAISATAIARIAGECHVDHPSSIKKEMPRSPGLKYVHYAPEVPLYLVESQKVSHIIEELKKDKKRIALLYESDLLVQEHIEVKKHIGSDEDEIGKRLYNLLRSFRIEEVDVIVCEFPKLHDHSAIIDRLKRAATKVVM